MQSTLHKNKSRKKKAKMQKNRINQYLAAIVTACLLFVSCQNKNEDNNKLFNTLIVEKTAALCENEGSPECKINIEIDEINDTTEASNKINKTIIQAAFGREEEALETAIDSFCANYIFRYKDALSKLYEADLRAGVSSSWYDYRYKLKSEHSDGYSDCLCYKITTLRYEGGAREYSQITCMNFDKQTGEQIELQDLLLPTYVSELPPLLLEKLLDDFECEDIEALHQKGVLRLTDVYIPANYLLCDDYISFIYNTDEIAPYETGAVSVDISYKEIEALLK